MTNSASSKCDFIKRCAVCKIDLKGRFVYVDGEVEKLFGFPREELFGKPIQDFVCNNSRQAIEHLFSQRNNYEICYNTLNLSFKNADNNTVKVSTVVSLNLISGNPVNYILIFTSFEDELCEPENISNNNEYSDNLKALLQIGKDVDISKNLEHICSFTNTKHICMYFINGEKLELRYIVDHDERDFDIPEPVVLHHKVAETGETYDFTNSEIDDFLKEYICRLQVSESEYVLLRFMYDNNLDDESYKDILDRTKLSILLLERLYSLQAEDNNEPNGAINIQFVVGLLDSMNIGAVLTEYNGDIVGFNRNMKDTFGIPEVKGNIREFINLIDQHNEISQETVLMDNFLNSFDSPDINKCQVLLPSGDSAMVTSLRLGETLDDLSSLVVLVPCYSENTQIISDNSQFWIDSVNVIYKLLSNSTKKTTGEFVDGLVKMLDVSDTFTKPNRVDLNVLVNDVYKNVKSKFKIKKILTRIESLPILTIPEEMIRLILEEIFKNAIEYNDNPQPTISVRADLFAEICCLSISDNGSGMTDMQLLQNDKIIEGISKGSNDKKYSSGLAKVNYMLNSIDGRIDINSSKSEGTTVTISFPISDNPSDLFTDSNEFLINESKSLDSSHIS